MADAEDVFMKALDVVEKLGLSGLEALTRAAELDVQRQLAKAQEPTATESVASTDHSSHPNHPGHPGPCALQILGCFYSREKALGIALEQTCFPMDCGIASRQALVLLKREFPLAAWQAPDLHDALERIADWFEIPETLGDTPSSAMADYAESGAQCSVVAWNAARLLRAIARGEIPLPEGST